MTRNRSSLSKAQSYQEIGEFWDTHDLSEHWEKTEHTEFTVDIQSEITYFAVENSLSEKLRTIAKQHGVSADTLLNLWLQERLQEQKT